SRRQAARRTHQVLAGDVDGNVAGRRVHVVEQQARLRTAPAAVLDQQATRPEPLHDGAEVPLQDRPFRARRVVRLQFADAVEEVRATGVVQVLAGQYLRALPQPGQ